MFTSCFLPLSVQVVQTTVDRGQHRERTLNLVCVFIQDAPPGPEEEGGSGKNSWRPRTHSTSNIAFWLYGELEVRTFKS